MTARKKGEDRARARAFSLAYALAGFAAALTLSQPAAADPLCPGGTAGILTTCSDASDVVRQRIDRTLATDPASTRVDIRMLQAAQAGNGTVPFAMRPDGNLTQFGTSLAQWNSAFAAADGEDINQAKAIADSLQLPRPAQAADRSFDIWAQSRVEPTTPEGDFKTRRTATTSVGADYRLHSDLLLGALVQFDDAYTNVLGMPESVTGSGYLAGPYLALRLSPNLVFDTKAAWGGAQDSALGAYQTDTFNATRTLGAARLTGTWNWDSWRFSQSGALVRAGELSHSDIPGMPGTKVDVTRVLVGPELRRQIDAGDGNLLEPFVFLKTSLNLNDDSSLETSTAQNMLGGGFILSRPNDYTIRATADYTETLTTEGRDILGGRLETKDVLTGKVQVNLPLQ